MLLVTQMKKNMKAEKWGSTTGEYRGYYLCVRVDEITTKYYFGETYNEALANFEKACDQWLTPKNGWRYWVDRSSGLDVKGCPAWGNIDIVDHFC